MKILTAEIWHRSQLFLPVLGHLDGLVLPVLALACQALLCSMLDDLGQVVGLEGVQYIEKVIPWRTFAFRILVWKVQLELRVLSHGWIDVLHRQLLIVWHIDGHHVHLLEQLLLAGEHGLDEVLGHDGLVGQVKLNCNEIRINRYRYVRCWPKKTTKSCLERNLPIIAWYSTSTMLRFLWLVCSRFSIKILAGIIALSAGDILWLQVIPGWSAGTYVKCVFGEIRHRIPNPLADLDRTGAGRAKTGADVERKG